MRQKRAKAYKKLMATYERTFQFRKPYQVLITADFLEDSIAQKLDPVLGLMRILQVSKREELKCMITQCCIKELYDMGDSARRSTSLAKTFERRRCGHIESPSTPSDCLSECIGANNRNRYIVATNNQVLRAQLRQVPGLPLVYINRSVMILEPPSPATLGRKEEKERGKMGVSEGEAAILGSRKRKRPTSDDQARNREREEGENDDDEEEDEEADRNEGENGEESSTSKLNQVQMKKKKRGGPKEPNPLSAKKKKTTPTASAIIQKSGQMTTVNSDRQALVDKAEGKEVPGKRKRKHNRSKRADVLGSGSKDDEKEA